MWCETEKKEKTAEKLVISNLLYLAQCTAGMQDCRKYTQYALQLMKKAKLMPFERKQLEWENPDLTLSRELGLEILDRMRELEDFYVFFYDGEREIECGTLNGITMLRDEDGWIPVRNDFMQEAAQSETFHMIGIETYLLNKRYAGLVGIAKEIQEITRGRAEIIVDTNPGLYVFPKGQNIKNKK